MWTIYYADGSTYSSKDGSPYDAPRRGVEVILATSFEAEGKNVSLLSNSDYYYWEPEVCEWGWWHCDQWGVFMHLTRAKRPLVLFGEYVDSGRFSEIEKRAVADAGNMKRHWWRGGPSSEPGKVVNG